MYGNRNLKERHYAQKNGFVRTKQKLKKNELSDECFLNVPDLSSSLRTSCFMENMKMLPYSI